MCKGKRFFSMILSASLLLTLGLCGCNSESGKRSKAEGKLTEWTFYEPVKTIPTTDTDPGKPVDPTTPSDPGKPSKHAPRVAISLPTRDLMRWDNDGQDMKGALEKLGYEVDLQYANNDVQTQFQQIESMINADCDVLVVAGIVSTSLDAVLKLAKEKNIPVIAYDRLILDSDAVSYYITFDNYMVGQLQGEYIRDALQLDSTAGPYNIEIFAGDPSDNNAAFFYNGAMDVLRPYIDSGKLVVVSGQTDFDTVGTMGWKTDLAQERMESIIAAFYQENQIDAVLCSNDSTALGVENALAAFYTGKYPVITGQDCDLANMKNILADKQSMSVFKDTRTLAACTVNMVDDILHGKEPAINDRTTYNNGAKTVDTYLCTPVFVTKDNYKTILVDSGYYTEDQLS